MARKEVYKNQGVDADIERVCHPANVYMLLQYLLLFEKHDIDHTFFFFHSGHIPRSVIDKFPHKYVSNAHQFPRVFRILALVQFWFITRFQEKIWTFLASSERYIADHTYLGQVLSYRRCYNLLEDGYALYRMPLLELPGGWLHKKVLQCVFGGDAMNIWGRKKTCKLIYATHALPKKSQLNGMKPIRLIDLKDLWAHSKNEKRIYLSRIFNVDQRDLEFFKKATVILLTQPLSEDGFCSEREKVDGYKAILRTYVDVENENIVIKTHPRERTDYRKSLNPHNAYVFDKLCPMEYINLAVGNNIRRVITLNSTSILSFGDEVEKVFAGNAYFPSLVKEYGLQEPCVQMRGEYV